MAQFQPSGFSVLPPVVKNLIIINALVFLCTMAMQSVFHIDLNNYLGLHYITASDFHLYQIATYMFAHGSFEHLFFNMFALWMFGNTLENIWGQKRFLIYYVICGIGAAVAQEIVWAFQVNDIMQYTGVNIGTMVVPVKEYINMMTTVGASGSIFGILLAFGMMFPNSMIYLYFLFPIKTKWFVLGYGVLELINGILGRGGNVAHFAHLGGMIIGLFVILYWKKKGRLY